jgi:ERCC4-type nuclease
LLNLNPNRRFFIISEEQLIVEVDTKEPESMYEEVVYQATTNPKFKNIKVVRHGLVLGDYKCKNLGIERKTVSDFVASIHDTRVMNQVFGMVNNYEYVYLLVSGFLKPSKTLKDEDIRSILSSCADFEARYNIRIQFLPNDEYLAHYALVLCIKHASELKPLYALHRPELKTDDEAMLMMLGIKGVGEKKANALLDYNSISYISMCDPNVLCSIPNAKINQKLAMHIEEVLNHKRIKEEIKDERPEPPAKTKPKWKRKQTNSK